MSCATFHAATALRVNSPRRPSTTPGQKFSPSKKICSRNSASNSSTVGATTTGARGPTFTPTSLAGACAHAAPEAAITPAAPATNKKIKSCLMPPTKCRVLPQPQHAAWRRTQIQSCCPHILAPYPSSPDLPLPLLTTTTTTTTPPDEIPPPPFMACRHRRHRRR